MIDFFPFRNLIESFRENFSAMSLKRGENIQFSFLNHDASEARRYCIFCSEFKQRNHQR